MSRAVMVAAILFAGFAAAFALLMAPGDSDMFWHLTSGDWMLDHGQLIDRDMWSFTRDGTPYSVGAWLGQIALALAFRSGGWLGIDILRAALVGIAAFLVTRLVMRVQPHLGWAALPILGTILVSRMVWGDRPQLFTLALFPLTLDLLMAARLEHRTARLFALPPLFLLWGNLHNSFVIGLVAIGVFVIESYLDGDRRYRRPFTVALIASLVASQLNPSGLASLGRAAGYAGSLPGWVVEEGPLDVLTGAGLVFAALLLACVATAMLRGREGIAARLGAPLLWPGLIVPFGLLALAIQRNTPYACMVMAPFAAAMVPEALGRARPVVFEPPRIAVAVTAALVGVVLVATAMLTAPRDPDLSSYPAGALTTLAATPGNMLNEYDWGGYLIRYAPAHRTFIDGRGAQLFTPQILTDFQDAVALHAGYRDILTRWDIAVVLIRPDRPLAGALARDGWRTAASGARWVLLVRP